MDSNQSGAVGGVIWGLIVKLAPQNQEFVNIYCFWEKLSAKKNCQQFGQCQKEGVLFHGKITAYLLSIGFDPLRGPQASRLSTGIPTMTQKECFDL